MGTILLRGISINYVTRISKFLDPLPLCHIPKDASHFPIFTFSLSLLYCDVTFIPYNLIIVENLSVFAKNCLLTIFWLDLFYRHFHVGIIITWNLRNIFENWKKMFNLIFVTSHFLRSPEPPVKFCHKSGMPSSSLLCAVIYGRLLKDQEARVQSQLTAII